MPRWKDEIRQLSVGVAPWLSEGPELAKVVREIQQADQRPILLRLPEDQIPEILQPEPGASHPALARHRLVFIRRLVNAGVIHDGPGHPRYPWRDPAALDLASHK